jgi:hypothetical protein
MGCSIAILNERKENESIDAGLDEVVFLFICDVMSAAN